MTETWKALQLLRSLGELRDLDLAVARLLDDFSPSGEAAPEVTLAAALVSQATGEGHTCLDLAARAGTLWLPTPLAEAEDAADPNLPKRALPELAAWRELLRAAPGVGAPGEQQPLILDAADRLYLHRYWLYEGQVVTRLRELAAPLPARDWPADLGARIAAAFPDADDPDADRRRLATFAALGRRLTILSGGPGTGKTTTIARIIGLLQQTCGLTRIRLAAPTGKAAKRMTESLRAHRRHLPADLPADAATLHRLLGYVPGSTRFRHHRDNPLAADLLIVDEASMIDLPMMAKLLDAIGPETRLVLLGDMDQLASVEPGAVFGDICRAATAEAFSADFLAAYAALTHLAPADPRLARGAAVSPLADCHVQLRHSHRFPAASTVGRLAATVNAGRDPAAAWALANTPAAPDAATRIVCHSLPGGLRAEGRRPRRPLRERILAGYRAFLDAEDPAAAFAALADFTILCAARRGPYGVGALNQIAEEVLSLRQMELEPALRPRHPLHPNAGMYPRRVIMITENDYEHGLFNGDLGVILRGPGGAGDELLAWFPDSPGADGEPQFRCLAPARLPAHETAFAMTIHKSQGSEFANLLVVLPDTPSPLLTRELLYTAITRLKPDPDRPDASGRLDLVCTQPIFAQTVRDATQRNTGLADRLLG